MRSLRLALAGNPNSGKTTLFNALTGARQHVGNYPGVTVERKEGVFNLDGRRVNVLDLPGCYSLTSYTPEELVARNVLLTEAPSAVVHVADATALERSLYLTVQFLELGFPTVVALNMMDEARRSGIRVDSAKLSALMGVPVVETVARTGQGKQELMEEAVRYAEARQGGAAPLEISYGSDIDAALLDMTAIMEGRLQLAGGQPDRWVALKLLEGDEEVAETLRSQDPGLLDKLMERVEIVRAHLEATLQTHPEAVIADYRYGYITGVLKQGVLTRTEERNKRMEMTHRLDGVLTHRLLGPVIMLAVLYGVFVATFALGEIPMGWVESFFASLSAGVESAMPDTMLRSLLVSGVIDGVGGVLGFAPLIVVMFFVLTFLEDVGYMARIAYMLDRVFRIFGLHGCSVMPFLVSGGMPGGCAVPGVMASRTLRSPKEKLATLLTAPFMTCGAKVPVFVLLAAAFFPGNEAMVMFWITMSAWALALIVSRVLRSTVLRGDSTPFVMELPPYRLPTLRGLCIHTWERGWQYVRKAGTVILAISIILWALMTFPHLPAERVAHYEGLRQEAAADRIEAIDHQQSQEALRHSIAGRIGVALEPVTSIAGFDWRTNIALVGGFAAKEVIVSTLGTAYSLGDVDPEESQPLSERIAGDPQWTTATALAVMFFVLLYSPCFVTVAVMARESSWKWAAASMVCNTILALGVATTLYHVTRMVTTV